jgi:hypothetical protein
VIQSAFAWVIASSGTWGLICYSFLVTLGVCWCLDGLEQQRSCGKSWWLFLATSRWLMRGSCAFSGGAPKATLVDCAWLVWSPSCVSCAEPDCGLDVWCLLPCETLSGWIIITGTSLLASKWTLEKKHCVILSSKISLVFIDILCLITCHGGITLLPLLYLLF